MSRTSKYNKLSQDEEDQNIYPTATPVPLPAVSASPNGTLPPGYIPPAHPAVVEGVVIEGNTLTD